MGAWGYEPHENDTAWDWEYDHKNSTPEQFAQLISGITEKTNENIIRILAQTIIDNTTMDAATKKPLVTPLVPILEDMITSDFIVEWTNPEDIVTSLTTQLFAIQQLLDYDSTIVDIP